MTRPCPLCGGKGGVLRQVAVVLERNEVWVDGVAVVVPPSSAEIGYVLWREWPHLVSKGDLISALYGGGPEPKSAETCLEIGIMHLRRHLEGTRIRVETRYGLGYAMRLESS